MAANETKDSLTLYLAQQLIEKSSTANLMTATRQSVMTNFECSEIPAVSTQEEADTLMLLHAVQVASTGHNVHIYSQDTDVLLLALRRVPLLGLNPVMVMGTGQNRRKVYLRPIFEKLGEKKSAALINWHALTGCDTTGHIQGKSKAGCFAAFLACSNEVIEAIADLGVGDQPSETVTHGCEEFLMSLFRPKNMNSISAKELRWKLFKALKEDQGVNKLPPTPGAWCEHIKRAHMQANIWAQDIIPNPELPDPLTLGWKQESGQFVPLLSQVPAAPDSIMQLVKCNCQSERKCSRRCSCKSKNLVCTELCSCSADETCCNTNPHIIGNDIEEM